MPKWLVYGEEPYLIDKFRKKIIDEVKTPEFNLMETSEFTEAEQNFLCQHALFGDKKVLIYRANSLKESGEFVKYVSEKGKTTDTYIFVQEVDRRSKVYKMFKKEEVQVFKKLSRDVLEKTVMQFVKKAGCEITTEAYQLYLQLINYDSEETNLYDVLHSLKRLCAVKEITKETVEYTVLDREQENIFLLIQLIMQGKYSDVFRQAELILQNQPNNVIGVLSLLLRSYRLAYKMEVCHCSLSALGVNGRTFVPRMSADRCSEAMDVLDDMVNLIKRGTYRPDIALKVALAKLCCLQNGHEGNSQGELLKKGKI